MTMQSQSDSHLLLVSDRSDPMTLLTHLVMALCESHNLDLTETTEKLQHLIVELRDDVVKKKMDHDEFNILASFITRIANSDEKTIEEFLQYVETTTH